LSPGVEAPGVSVSPTSLASLERSATCDGPVYLAWFGPVDQAPAALESPAQLARRVTLTSVARLNDGTLFAIEPNPAVKARC